MLPDYNKSLENRLIGLIGNQHIACCYSNFSFMLRNRQTKKEPINIVKKRNRLEITAKREWLICRDILRKPIKYRSYDC